MSSKKSKKQINSKIKLNALMKNIIYVQND